jgi:extradiol dioxygenase family protein
MPAGGFRSVVLRVNCVLDSLRSNIMPVMPFHLAFPVTSLEEARAFYGGLLGCPEGRSSPEWVDFDFHGHQIVAHLSPDAGHLETNLVDGDNVPVRHFGVVLPMDQWQKLADKLKAAEIAHPLQGSAGGAGDDVFSRPLRQRDRVQGLRESRDAVCEMTFRTPAVS